jgi:UDP-GlcNAc:undecaprenyl-phosphate GlcNAc-1-phosphate transferase
MSPTAIIVLGLAVAGVAAYLLTGIAVRVALATGFVDHPHGYKGHLAATPYLGGAAVMCSVLATTLLLTEPGWALAAVLGCAVALAVIGTIDDRVAVAPRWRVACELGAAGILFAAGVHWAPFGVGVLDFGLTAAWVIGIVNAYNLMDNIDGATGTVTSISAAAIGAIALLDDRTAIAVTAFALAGACLGFLPHNLARPARIFLGDGGSMPAGFLVAALSMAALDSGPLGSSAIIAGALVAGLPILDTTLVVISRRRRGVPFVTGGRDHLTHRILARVGSARRVALVLAAGQGALVILAVAASQLDDTAFNIVVAVAAAAAGAAAIVALESPALRPSCEFERGRDREVEARRLPGPPEGQAPPRVAGGVRGAEATVRYSTVVEDPTRSRANRSGKR